MSDETITLEQVRKLEQQGDDAGAEAAYRRLLRNDPHNVELLVGRATALINLEAYDEAHAELARATALAPQSALAHVNLGIAQFMLGWMRLADASFARALELAPERADFRDRWRALKSRPYLTSTGYQGAHAPERQVYMSAVVDLVKDAGPALSILEIGSYMGASLLTWVNAVERLHGGPATIVCVDPWGLRDTTAGYEAPMAAALTSSQAYEIFLHNASLTKGAVSVRHIRDVSENALPLLRDGQFDIVYVDGSHLYREALYDLTESRRLVKPGGVLCGDDLELQLDECDAEQVRQHAGEDWIHDRRHDVHFHPGVTLAVHELFGRVSSFSGFWAARKTGESFSSVSLAGAQGVVPPHWPDEIAERLRAHFRNSSLLGRLSA